MSESNGHARKVICLGMPSYGNLSAGAAVGFHRCTRRKCHHVELQNYGSSLLALNFNRLWCWALNSAMRGQVDYFAMQHADIEPGEFWLDAMIDELEARSLDVLGAVAPIKDPRGLTSVAVASDNGDNWRPKHRLTMHEVYRLPETFTSEDVGGPLLINTGLWVCRFNLDWAPKIFFTVNDRININRATGEYVPQVEPEDWFFSRLCHELGLRVGCTRKVPLWHRGEMAFGSGHAWGTDRFDKEYTRASFLDDTGAPPVAAFPHEVAGWLTEDEGRALARLATGKRVIEIGSYCGRSTICLAQVAHSVACVDTFDGRGTALPGDTEALFRRNLVRYGVSDKVSVYRGESVETLACLPPVYELAFIDGSHDRASVLADARAARACLVPGGLIAFHDYGGADVGVTQAVDEFVAAGGEILHRTGTLAVVRPPAARPTPLETCHA